MNQKFIRSYQNLIREHSDFKRCDLTKLLGNSQAFGQIVLNLAKPFTDQNITKVAALDALGFALGGAVAYELKAGLVLIRKQGKSAWPYRSITFTDYTGKEKRFELASDALDSNDLVLIIDEWSETGTQLKTAIKVIEQTDARLAGIACINIDPKVRRDKRLQKYKLHTLVE